VSRRNAAAESGTWPGGTIGPVIDLHVHSTCSDGSETPEEVVSLAAAAGCSAVALTDHDGLAGIAEARAKAECLGIGFVPGCEVSCAFSPGTMHLLAYFVEPGEGPMQNELTNMREERATRNERLVNKLQDLGLPVSLEQVQSAAGSSVVGRPHFAAVLVANGAATTIQDAFDRLLAKGAPGYVPKSRIDFASFITTTRASGAVAVLAHPLSLGLDPAGLEGILTELAEGGLAGLECYYSRYSPEERAGLAEMARRHDLVATGGSDYHGRFKPDIFVGVGTGDLDVPDSALGELLARRPDTAT
jgi:predicted metal-dependent phosphoesterase TrpH